MAQYSTLKKIALILVLLPLVGLGCEGVKGPDRPVLLNQGRPPEDCGQRNPDKLQPYFVIENPEIKLGESLRIDATCSVGRIASIQWDFDIYEWPEGTPPEERLNPPIQIRHRDLAPDYLPTDGWELNNSGPFIQLFTPTREGTNTVSLLVTDYRGQQQVVIANYLVRLDTPGSQAISNLNQSLNSNFILTHQSNPQKNIRTSYVTPSSEDGLIYVPWPGSGHNLTAWPTGVQGDIESYIWTVERVGSSDPGTIKTSGAVQYTSRSTNISNFSFSKSLLATTAPGDRLFSYQEGPYSSSDRPDDPQETEFIDFDVSLTLRSEAGHTETNQQRYRLIHSPTAKELIAQMALIPKSILSQSNAGSLTPSVNQSRTDLDHWRGDGALTFAPGDQFLLQNFSIIPSGPNVDSDVGGEYEGVILRYSRLIHPLKIEFDPGDGVFREAATIPSRYQLDLARYYAEAFVTQEFTAPAQPGDYTARMRITYGPASGTPIQKTTSLSYKVAAPAVPELSASPATGIVNEEVRFSLLPRPRQGGTLYQWRVTNKRTGEIISDEFRFDELRNFLAWRFTEPGTYEIMAQITDTLEGALTFTTEYTVVANPSQQRTGNVFDSVDYTPVGVAVAPGIRNPINDTDDIVFYINGIKPTAKTIEVDVDGNGTPDETCEVRNYSGSPTCQQFTVKGPFQAGSYSSIIKGRARNGQDVQIEVVDITINPSAQEVSTTDIQFQPTAIVNADLSLGIAQGAELNDPNKQTFVAEEPTRYFVARGPSSLFIEQPESVRTVDWDIDGDGTIDRTCVVAAVGDCYGPVQLIAPPPGRYTAVMIINGGEDRLQRDYWTEYP